MTGPFGPTGDYPSGKLNPHDDGGLNIGISTEKGNLRIDFGTKVAWLAMPPEQAELLALAILAHVQQMRRK